MLAPSPTSIRRSRPIPTSPAPGYSRGLAERDKRDCQKAIADFSQAIKLDAEERRRLQRPRRLLRRASTTTTTPSQDFDAALKLRPELRRRLLQPRHGLLRAARLRPRRRRPDPGDASRSARHRRRARPRPRLSRAPRLRPRHRRLRPALKLDPKFTAGFVDRGNAYQHKGDYDRAMHDYDQAIKLDPKNAAAFTERGNTYAPAARSTAPCRITSRRSSSTRTMPASSTAAPCCGSARAT